MLNQFRTQYLEAAAGKFNQWLASHNLPRWSVPVGWAVAVVPAITVAHYDIPPPVVSLFAVSGLMGLLWLIRDLSTANDFDPAVELLKQEIDSQNNGSLDEPESVISENLQDDLDVVNSDESSLDEVVSIAEEENNHYFAEEERFAVVSSLSRD
jgi:hypothetical protein